MNTIEFCNGRKLEFDEYGSFSDARDALRSCGNGHVSYYDADGDTHVCEFAVVRGGVYCLGLWCDLKGKDAYDHTRKHFSLDTYKAAKEIVQYECDDFLGWSL